MSDLPDPSPCFPQDLEGLQAIANRPPSVHLQDANATHLAKKNQRRWKSVNPLSTHRGLATLGLPLFTQADLKAGGAPLHQF